ncbi:hypothetical protein [uncultured Methanomethylovorans sp.]|uniref:hypothetical protein n=1 Tax=uncultured Methanomethylovorans sp. TaxID=183759 RepID=UPI002AA8B2FC|nr:hypothetical protein [uncultured Methanomethylovorans sp.]
MLRIESNICEIIKFQTNVTTVIPESFIAFQYTKTKSNATFGSHPWLTNYNSKIIKPHTIGKLFLIVFSTASAIISNTHIKPFSM